MKIYFAGSIRGGRDDKELYLELITLLKKHGNVLTEHVGDQGLSSLGEDGPNDNYIYRRDMTWLDQADILIAEVTTPSLGVGYEIAKADNKMPVLCLYREQEGKRLSGIISGADKIIVKKYTDINDAEKIINEFINNL